MHNIGQYMNVTEVQYAKVGSRPYLSVLHVVCSFINIIMKFNVPTYIVKITKAWNTVTFVHYDDIIYQGKAKTRFSYNLDESRVFSSLLREIQHKNNLKSSMKFSEPPIIRKNSVPTL